MLVQNLPDLAEIGVFTDNTILCTNLQSKSVKEIKDTYVDKTVDSYKIVCHDVRGHVVKLEIPFEDIHVFKELSAKPKWDNSIIEVIKYVNGHKKVNTIYEVKNDEGIYEFTTHSFSLNYPKLDKVIQETKAPFHIVGDYTVFSNEEYIFLVSNYYDIDKRKSIIMVPRTAIYTALINIQIHFGYKEIEMKALEIELPENMLVVDNSVISVGNSRLFRMNDLIYCVEQDLYNLVIDKEFMTSGSRVGLLRERLNATGSSKESIESTEIDVESIGREGKKIQSKNTFRIKRLVTNSNVVQVVVLGSTWNMSEYVRRGSLHDTDGDIGHLTKRSIREIDINKLADQEPLLEDRKLTNEEFGELGLPIPEVKSAKKFGLWGRRN